MVIINFSSSLICTDRCFLDRQVVILDSTQPIGPLSLYYEGISRLLKTQKQYIKFAFEKGFFTKEAQEVIKQYLSFELDDDETNSVGSDCIGTDDEDANEDDEIVDSDEQ